MKTKKLEIIVSIWIDEKTDAQEIVQQMDYSFSHPSIIKTEITELITEESAV